MMDHAAWTRAQANLTKMMNGEEVSPDEAREAVQMASRGDAQTLRAALHAARDAYHRSTGEDPRTSLLTKKKNAVHLLEQAGEFWNGYEGLPHGKHYATVRHAFTGSDAPYRDIHGVSHPPIKDLRDSLHAHARVSQEKLKLLRDRPDLQFRDGESGPEILLYRGVYGDYGTNVKKHPYEISVAPIQSWTTDADRAETFAEGDDDTSTNAVIAAWLPISQVVHVGAGTHIGYTPKQEVESEVVVHHPTGSLKPEKVYEHGEAGEHYGSGKRWGAVPPPRLAEASLHDAVNEHGPDSELTGKTLDSGLFKSEDLYDYRPVMHAVAQLESSGGKNRDHAPQTSGIHAGTRAVSSYGLMPATVYETVLKSPQFQHSKSGQAITAKNRFDPEHINSVTRDQAMDDDAFRHVWAYKRDRVSRFVPETEDRDAVTAFAHREGITGAKRAYLAGGMDAIMRHPYVQAFKRALGGQREQPLEKASVRHEVWVPDTDGEPHPEKPGYYAGKITGGELSWFPSKEQQTRVDQRLLEHAGRVLKSIPPTQQQAFVDMVKHVASDPDRHAVRGGSGTGTSVRARHLLSALSGQEGYTLAHDGAFVLSAVRHSQNPNNEGVVSTWRFDPEKLKFLSTGTKRQ